MSVRAIAIRSGPRPLVRARSTISRSTVSGRTMSPVRVRAGTRPGRVRRRAFWTAFADDRGLIGVKLILIGIVALAMMALEVPW